LGEIDKSFRRRRLGALHKASRLSMSSRWRPTRRTSDFAKIHAVRREFFPKDPLLRSRWRGWSIQGRSSNSSASCWRRKGT